MHLNIAIAGDHYTVELMDKIESVLNLTSAFDGDEKRTKMLQDFDTLAEF